MQKATSAINALIAPAIEALGYECVGVIYLPQGRHSLLRIFIDTPNGITLDDCEKVSRQISAVLDVNDPISGHYTLEVSSPGTDRPLFTLAQYQRFIGQTIKLHLHAPLEGRRNFTGVLIQIQDQHITLQVDQKVISLPFVSIEKANLVATEVKPQGSRVNAQRGKGDE